MAVFDVGRVCRKTSGLEAGKLCVVLSKPEKGFVVAAGPDVKKGSVNINHLEPLPNTVGVGKQADEAEATELLKKEGLIL